MKRKKVFTLFLLMALTFLLIGCNKKSAGVLETGKTYFGKNATNEIIEVNSKDQWIIKNMNKDDTNYAVVNVSETGEKIGDYPVFRITAEEMYGDLDSAFVRREGKNYIIGEDEEGIYFEPVNNESNIEKVKKEIEEVEDTNAYIKEIANFDFKKQ